MALYRLTIEEFIRQQLGDIDTRDYFPGVGELEGIVWRHIVCRNTMSLILSPMGIRLTPLSPPGDTGSCWGYLITQYDYSLYANILRACECGEYFHQPQHKYAMFQVNVFDDGVLVTDATIDEISLMVTFSADTNGPITMEGYPVNLSRLMHGIFMAIADDEGKLGVYQSTFGGTTDMRDASKIAMDRAGKWLSGTFVYKRPLSGRGY